LRQEDVDDTVDRERGKFNRKVKEVLKRKLRTFLAWKEHTFEELKNRRVFTLKYLRQHYEVIKMYMAWVKPYLRNIQRLQLDQSKTETPDLIVAFESSMIEVEIMARKPTNDTEYGEHGKVNSVILQHFLFRTRPDMSYSQEYQRGPIHVGRIEINFRAYAWTDKEVENYKRMRDQEDFQLLGILDASVKAAMEALGDELMRYLQEAGEEMEKPAEDKKTLIKTKSLADPYVSVFKGLSELFGKKKQEAKKTAPKKVNVLQLEIAKKAAEADAKSNMWNMYHHFKKNHGMLNW